MRIALVGTVESSRVALEALRAAGAPPSLVLTLPPELAQRHSDYADIATAARAAGIPVEFTSSINDTNTLSALRAAEPEFCFVVGWSQVCGPEFLGIASGGTIGFHPSALPLMRGRAVIPWTILKGEREAGSTLLWLDEGVDSGPILLQRRFQVAEDETAKTLYGKHMQNLAAMIPDALSSIASGSPPRIVQDHALATYCAKRTDDDGLIDWRKPATDVLRLVRAAGAPYPGAFTYLAAERVRIDRAQIDPVGHQFIGIAGQIQGRTDRGFRVKCGDGECLEVLEWRSDSGKSPKVHSKFRDMAAA